MPGNSTRARILDAAEARLLELGPIGLVLSAVACDAGVSKGGLLYHFRSKDALVAGVVARMLDGFDEVQDEAAGDDSEPAGAWARAYLSSTVTETGEPADNSAQLMAGILAALGSKSPQLELLRERFAGWQQRLLADGADPTLAAIVQLAADGLWLSSLLGLPPLPAQTRAEVVRRLRDMTRKPA